MIPKTPATPQKKSRRAQPVSFKIPEGAKLPTESPTAHLARGRADRIRAFQRNTGA